MKSDEMRVLCLKENLIAYIWLHPHFNWVESQEIQAQCVTIQNTIFV